MKIVELPQTTVSKYFDQILTIDDLSLLCNLYRCNFSQISRLGEERVFVEFVFFIIRNDSSLNINFRSVVQLATVIEVLRTHFTKNQLTELMLKFGFRASTHTKDPMESMILKFLKSLKDAKSYETFIYSILKRYSNEIGNIKILMSARNPQ